VLFTNEFPYFIECICDCILAINTLNLFFFHLAFSLSVAARCSKLSQCDAWEEMQLQWQHFNDPTVPKIIFKHVNRLAKRLFLNRNVGESENLDLRGPMAKCKESMRSLGQLFHAKISRSKINHENGKS